MDLFLELFLCRRPSHFFPFITQKNSDTESNMRIQNLTLNLLQLSYYEFTYNTFGICRQDIKSLVFLLTDALIQTNKQGSLLVLL